MEPILSYQYKDKYYHSKYDCCQEALRDGVPLAQLTSYIKAVLFKNPKLFSDCDFKTEPKQDWYEMCVERAHELRQKHKYLALAFSGGSDSAFILDIFLKNNIPLDEVYTVLGNPFKDKNLPLHLDGGFWEVYNHAIPHMQAVQKQYNIKTKFTVHDNYEDVFTGHFNPSLFDNAHHGIFYTPTGNAHHSIIQRYKAQDRFIINGAFEPNIGYSRGKYFMELWDTDNTSQLCHWNYIPFFLPDNNLKMHSKQCHLVIKHLKTYGYVDRKTNYPDYHKAQILSTRKWLYNFNESPYFAPNANYKEKDPKASLFGNLKTRSFLRALNHFGIDDYKKTLNDFWFEPKVNNINIFRLPYGFQIAKQYLE